MPSSTVRHYTDPDDFAASIRAAKTELTIVGCGNFDAGITRIDFHHLWMQRFSENLPRVMHSGTNSGRPTVTFHTQPGPNLLRAGVEVSSDSIARPPKDFDYFQRSSAPVCWGAMSLPMEVMHAVGIAISGADLTPPPQEQIVTPSASAMARLQRLHAEAGSLAAHTPDIIANDAAAHGLEQALVQAMVACLTTADAEEDTSAKRRHERIMRRFHNVIAERQDESIYIPDLCAAIGVPERTLRLCCHECFGMSPKRYLLLRRMNLARQALRNGDAMAKTVTAIAAQYGFWNFGRFSVEYKALFGEMPSASLHGSVSSNRLPH